MLPTHAELYRALRARWGSAPGADRGEAASITLAFANRWGFITDDGVAFRTAERPPACIATMRTTALILGMARAAWISADDGWAAVGAMTLAKRDKLGPIPWNDQASFAALCEVVGFDIPPGCN